MVQPNQGHPLEPRSTIEGLHCISHNNRRTAKLKIVTLRLSMGIVCDLACVQVKYLPSNINTNMGIRDQNLSRCPAWYPEKNVPEALVYFQTNRINKSVPTYIAPELKNINHVLNLSNFLFRL